MHRHNTSFLVPPLEPCYAASHSIETYRHIASHDCMWLLFVVSLTLTFLRLTCRAMKHTWWLVRSRALCGVAITFHVYTLQHVDMSLLHTSIASLARHCVEASSWSTSQVCCCFLIFWLSFMLWHFLGYGIQRGIINSHIVTIVTL